jgi:hypothetical protein
MLLRPLLRADASRKQSLLTPEEEDDAADDEDATLSGDGADDGGGSGGHRSIPAASVSPLLMYVSIICRSSTLLSHHCMYNARSFQYRSQSAETAHRQHAGSGQLDLHRCRSAITLTPSGRLGGTVHRSSAVSAVMPSCRRRRQ